ncbi:MAG: phosphoadenylyl-sulfate reductase [Myxococcota bacterium]|nr:phosphoadenylyl-sulfate reductase [Myxococcota bacterium]
MMPANLHPSDAEGIVAWALQQWEHRLTIACSFSKEDILLVDFARRINPSVRVFALDTGRLHAETLQTAERVRTEMAVSIEWYAPKTHDVELLVSRSGLFSFRESVENRRECCHIRKVEPLLRALSGVDAWITGQRRAHGPTRAGLKVFESAPNGEPLKLNPLAFWSTAQVDNEIAARRLPVNPLYDQGFPSIGCAPCTRAVQPGEDDRAGRWWWEAAEHKECGLHGRAPWLSELNTNENNNTHIVEVSR